MTSQLDTTEESVFQIGDVAEPQTCELFRRERSGALDVPGAPAS